jgi:hypothetical protein
MIKQFAQKTIIFLLALIFLGGCAEKGPGDVYHDELMDFASIQTIGVLPFTNLTADPMGAARARDTLTTMLMATGAIYVIPHGEVARGIARAGLADPTQPTPAEIKKIAGIIEADAIISGVLREYGEARSGSIAAPVISISLQMYDRESGTVIWVGSTTRGGVDMGDRLFGSGGEPFDVVTREAVNDLLDRLFQ